MEEKEIKMVYDALLSAPGMEQQVRIDLRLDRKTALFLVNTIERGLAAGRNQRSNLLSHSAEATRDLLGGIAASILEKAGLSEMHRKLGAFLGD